MNQTKTETPAGPTSTGNQANDGTHRDISDISSVLCFGFREHGYSDCVVLWGVSSRGLVMKEGMG